MKGRGAERSQALKESERARPTIAGRALAWRSAITGRVLGERDRFIMEAPTRRVLALLYSASEKGSRAARSTRAAESTLRVTGRMGSSGISCFLTWVHEDIVSAVPRWMVNAFILTTYKHNTLRLKEVSRMRLWSLSLGFLCLLSACDEAPEGSTAPPMSTTGCQLNSDCAAGEPRACSVCRGLSADLLHAGVIARKGRR